MRIEIPNDVRQIMDELNKSGFEAYIVGGCVRDSLLGVMPEDWDIATNAEPDDMRKVFANYHLLPTGERYGTMTVMMNAAPYEVTTYRADGNYSDGRRPDSVTYSQTLKDDLRRRDLTINAMAYSEASGLTDCFGGYDDIKAGVVRCVGNPADRFNEDALRVMRTVRFAVNLDFDISKETAEAIRECGENLKNVSRERKRGELIKILRGIKRLSKDSGHYTTLRSTIEYIITLIIPEFRDSAPAARNGPLHRADVFTHTMEMLFMADTDDIELLLAVLLHGTGKMEACGPGEKRQMGHHRGPGEKRQADYHRGPGEKRQAEHHHNHSAFSSFSSGAAKTILEDLRFDNKTAGRVLQLIEGHDFVIRNDRKCAKRLLNKFGLDLCLKLLEFRALKFQLTDGAARRRNDPDKAARGGNGPNDYQSRASDIRDIKNTLREIVESKEAFKISDLAVTGNDLIEMGFEQGKGVGEALERCLDYVIENPGMNSRAELLKYVNTLTCERLC